MANTGRCEKCGADNPLTAVICHLCHSRLPWAPPASGSVPPAGKPPQNPASYPQQVISGQGSRFEQTPSRFEQRPYPAPGESSRQPPRPYNYRGDDTGNGCACGRGMCCALPCLGCAFVLLFFLASILGVFTHQS